MSVLFCVLCVRRISKLRIPLSPPRNKTPHLPVRKLAPNNSPVLAQCLPRGCQVPLRTDTHPLLITQLPSPPTRISTENFCPKNHPPLHKTMAEGEEGRSRKFDPSNENSHRVFVGLLDTQKQHHLMWPLPLLPLSPLYCMTGLPLVLFASFHGHCLRLLLLPSSAPIPSLAQGMMQRYSSCSFSSSPNICR